MKFDKDFGVSKRIETLNFEFNHLNPFSTTRYRKFCFLLILLCKILLVNFKFVIKITLIANSFQILSISNFYY